MFLLGSTLDGILLQTGVSLSYAAFALLARGIGFFVGILLSGKKMIANL